MKTADCQSSTNIEKMLARANMFRVNVIYILMLITIRFFYTKILNEVKTDELNTEEVYGLCLLGEKNFGLLLMRVPKLPRKVCEFFYFSYVEISNHVLDRKFKKV